MAYQEPKKRTIRLDDDVYEALRKLPMSPNKFLRKVLSANGAFEPVNPSGATSDSLTLISQGDGVIVECGPRGATGKPLRLPLLKLKERK